MRRIRNRALVVFAIVLVSCVLAIAHAGGEGDCSCRANFDKLVEKVEANYIGFHLEKDGISQNYAKTRSRFSKIADKTGISECSRVLNRFLGIFKDGHLFVAEYPDFANSDLEAGQAFIRANKVDVGDLKSKMATGVDGFWTDGVSKFAIIKNVNTTIPFEHVAVVIESKDAAKIGEIKFAISKSDNKWEGIYYTNSYASRYVSIMALKGDKMLSLSGGLLWGRLYSRDAAIFQPTTPSMQRLDDKTTLLTIPSFLIERKTLDDVVNENSIINEVEHLIIDIRGNTGGNGVYFGLVNKYYEKPLVSPMGKAISSKDNIEYFVRFAGDKSDNLYARVVSDMKAMPGQIVAGPVYGTYTAVPAKNKLKKVVILMDRGVMSSAESFVLYSKGVSDKVITMGKIVPESLTTPALT